MFIDVPHQNLPDSLHGMQVPPPIVILRGTGNRRDTVIGEKGENRCTILKVAAIITTNALKPPPGQCRKTAALRAAAMTSISVLTSAASGKPPERLISTTGR
jgi:hypothetical protein